ncbi:sensor histidine kinase [Blastococcus saxobsidens]|uniref:histidine kinase n=1 Tax=Blastococcus saxobsidens (strain DD2) TaxID=1146883 RepID=H6RX92_BLASD|nr:sensor histidine kinase [Blastococcus saxobsidens]CCG04703.1 Two component integral membrane signal transduction histidine kinase [Blastococcus saxobsidens DD2]
MPGVGLLIGGVLVTWVASGLAAVCLTPRNPAARSLLAAGVLLAASTGAESLAREAAGGPVGFALWRTAGWITFLGAVAAIVLTLSRLPDGVADSVWHVRLARALAALAVAAPVLELVGSPTLAVDADSPARENPLAVAGLDPLGAAGAVVRATEPAWVLLGVALLLLRWRYGSTQRRHELSWALRSIGLLSALLVLIVVVEVTGAPIPPEVVFVPVFLLALALFPVALLVGITRRVRGLEARLVESRERLVTAEDAARRALERDLHDGVQQQLVAALSLTALAARHVERNPEVAGATVGEVGERVRGAMTELRELVRGIRPPVLQDAGLVPAIESRLSSLPAPVQLCTDADAVARRPAAVEAAAYFVVTEAVTNALKHAPCSRIAVRITGADDRLEVAVADDGPGPGAGTSAGGGLRGLQDRVESLRGTFSVTGGPGTGTVVRATFPGPGTPR